MPYGTESITFTCPPDCRPDILTYAPPDSEGDIRLLERALENPIGTPRLSNLAQGRSNAVILISDGSRLAPSYKYLPLLLKELNEGGIADKDIRIVVALGMHRVHTPDELRELTGTEFYNRVQVMNHSALEEDCVYLGDTSRGTPVCINRHVVEANLRIATGNLEPHRLVGMSGGVKALIPGCASHRCIEANHSLSKTYKATPGLIDNPLHEDLVEAQSFAPLHFLLNAVVNSEREILAAAAGDPIKAHQSLLERARSVFTVSPPEEPYDLVIASAGGAPKDQQLYQAVKALQNAVAFTKSGGCILLAAECGEHYGNGLMHYWMETIGDRQRILSLLDKKFVLGPHKFEHLFPIVDKHSVWLHSAIPEPLLDLLGFQKAAAGFQQTLEHIMATFKRKGQAPRIAILPYCSLTFSVDYNHS